MDSDATTVPKRTASELWQHFVDKGIFHPKTYDEDIVTLLDAQLPGTGSIRRRMRDAGWSAQDWLRAISPVLNSFSGLIGDLLSLYTEIGARQASEDNLVISYEFEDGNSFDQSLVQFKDAVAAVHHAQTTCGVFSAPDHAAHYFRLVSSHWHSFDPPPSALRPDPEQWNFTLPPPPETSDPAIARGVSLVYSVLTASCETLRSYGATMNAAHNNSWLHDSENNPLSSFHRGLYFAFTDYFPEVLISQLKVDVKSVSQKSSNDVNDWLHRIEKWSSVFWCVEAGNAEDALESVLSLPMWGKRHELYSAWVVCVIAEAFSNQNLQFEVADGRLSFPFRSTRIATFEDRSGPITLWSEMRSEASGNLSHGRKHGVQPDYRFLRPEQKPSDSERVIEVKQYRRAAGSRHGNTAKDYAQALPRAKVSLVAHGPIGSSAITRVDEHNRSRVSFHENMRSLNSAESREFIEELRQEFPPAVHLTNLRVIDTNVNCPEIRIIGRQMASGAETILDQGKTVHLPAPLREGEVFLEIVCHPEHNHTIDKAGLTILATYSDGTEARLIPISPNTSRTWHVGTIRYSTFSQTKRTVEHLG